MSQLPEDPISKIPGASSFRPVYRDGAANHCPSCERSQWIVGRYSSECAFCGTVLPLQEGGMREAFTHDKAVYITRDSDGAVSAASVSTPAAPDDERPRVGPHVGDAAGAAGTSAAPRGFKKPALGGKQEEET